MKNTMLLKSLVVAMMLIQASSLPAAEPHSDIRIGKRNGQLTVNQEVHTATLVDGKSQNPGFVASGFAFQDSLHFDIAGPLIGWNGANWSVDHAADEQLIYFEPTTFGSPEKTVTISANTDFLPGFLIGRVNTLGKIHVHDVFQLTTPEGATPAAGAYGFSMVLRSPQYDTSAPFYILLNNGLSAEDFDAAVASFRQEELQLEVPVPYEFQVLDLVDAVNSQAARINNDGVIAGSLDGVDGTTRGYLYANGSEQERFSWPSSTFTEFWGVNTSGQVVGYYADPADPSFGTFFSFRREVDQTFSDTDWIDGQPINFGIDVGEAGEVLGQSSLQSWLLSPEGVHTALTVPDFETNAGWGLNDHGEVVGVAWPGFFDTPNGFIYDPVSRSYTIWSYPGAVQTSLHDINNRGDIVGTFKAGLDRGEQSFIRWADGSLQLIHFPGMATTRVWSINDDRAIVGRVTDGDGNRHSFLTNPIEPTYAITGIEASYLPGDIMQARIAGVTLEEGQEIQWRMRPVGTDFGGTVLSRFVPETDTPDARAGRLDMQLDASYDQYELVASVMEGEQAVATTEWAGPILVSNSVEPLSLTYVGPSPFLLGETASLEATGRELADGESLRVVSNTFFSHYSLWLPPYMGYHQTGDRMFAFEPPSRSAYPLALQVIRDGLVVAQSGAIEVDRSLIETLFSGMQPVYRAGQTFSATFTVVPDLGDKVTYSWAMYDDYENPMKVAQGEEGRTFEMPITADMDGARMFIQARVAYESGNDALVGGFYPYLTVVDDPSAQLFLFSSLPGHYHQGSPVDLQLFADPGLVEGDSIAWEWRWPGMDWETLPGAEGLSHQLTAEQAMDGLEVWATLTFADSEMDPMLAGPVTIYIDDHGAAPLQQPTVGGATSYTVGDQVTLTRALPEHGPTILTEHRWERKAVGDLEFSSVAGQTGATLSFAAALADNGAAYRVSILKPNGEVAYGPSPSVTLSVSE